MTSAPSTPGFGTDFRGASNGGPHHAVHRFLEGGFLYLDRDAVGPQSPDLPFVQIDQSVPVGEDHLCPSDLGPGTAMQNVA